MRGMELSSSIAAVAQRQRQDFFSLPRKYEVIMALFIEKGGFRRRLCCCWETPIMSNREENTGKIEEEEEEEVSFCSCCEKK